MRELRELIEALRDLPRYDDPNMDPWDMGRWMEAAEVEEAADKLLAAVEAQGWQPIETAPKDGTWVIVCLDRPSFYYPNTASFREYHPNAKGKREWRDHHGHIIGGTHWMPLPEPPKEV